ncbi:EAL domain-containing protein [Curvibacter sp. APW13]|uniref:putative bifunctional diguanylate cyclase/phosphodiesterase n=1 Tax=Curvibacter sp. APW13 TaxID=3077236 RepID=UPI0028DDA8B7|nr:EAL domain-containing protein [Curvibacter sp. APW13]MDT8990830.1 EAL domain-containing protein [Curvibacter sp. APW13]
MSDPLDLHAAETRALRARRLVQIALLVMVAMAIAMVFYAIKGSWQVVTPLVVGVFCMAGCLWLNARGHTDAANDVLISAVTLSMYSLVWVAEGLHDAALFTFPVLLILGGLLLRPLAFGVLLASQIAFLVILTMATEVWGWRVDATSSSNFELLRDVSMILLVGGVAVGLVVADLHRLLAHLRLQVQQQDVAQKELTYLSQHDGLTGLPNRAMGRQMLGQAIEHAARRNLGVALLFVDLDHFKHVNDTLGHDAGDEFLRKIALRLSAAVRGADIVARHGGDEFTMALTDVADAQDASTVAANVLRSLAEPIVIKGHELQAGCSIGVALFPQDGKDYASLLRAADIAMYQAKESGRNAFRFYSEEMNAQHQHAMTMASELRSALARDEFVLHYQPIVCLADGHLLGAEALVRWQHPTRGLLAPDQFIAAAEKSGLIVDLGQWVLLAACRQMRAWQVSGLTGLVVAVNLSPVQFRRGEVDAVVAQALQETGLPPEALELEIVESTLIDDTESFIVALGRIKALGVRIAIDDFGTGYSNLAYLQRFAVDKLKIDRSFVMHVSSDPQQRALVEAIVQMARSLSLTTTAEGIEDEAVRQLLLGLGCVQGQGYHFARPLSVADFEAYARHQVPARG